MGFLRGVLSETDWRGGMFDVLPGNARTNMEGEAIGFFTAADVLRDTIVRNYASEFPEVLFRG
jgi:hypothetical protein